MLKIMIPETWAETPPPLSFLPFHQGPSLCSTCRIPMVPILEIHTKIPPIQISSLGYQLCQLSEITHIYRTKIHGECRRPIGSLTMIHTNIPAITVTVVAMALFCVIKILYLYAFMSLTE